MNQLPTIPRKTKPSPASTTDRAYLRLLGAILERPIQDLREFALATAPVDTRRARPDGTFSSY